MSFTPLEGFLNKDQAAAALGVKPRTLDVWAAQRRGPPRVKYGRVILYQEISLRAWLEEHEVDLETARRKALGVSEAPPLRVAA